MLEEFVNSLNEEQKNNLYETLQKYLFEPIDMTTLRNLGIDLTRISPLYFVECDDTLIDANDIGIEIYSTNGDFRNSIISTSFLRLFHKCNGFAPSIDNDSVIELK